MKQQNYYKLKPTQTPVL